MFSGICLIFTTLLAVSHGGTSFAGAESAVPIGQIQSFRDAKSLPPTLTQGYEPANVLEVSSSPWGPTKPRLTATLIKTGILANTRGVFSAAHKFKSLLLKGTLNDELQGNWTVTAPEMVPGLNVRFSGDKWGSVVGAAEYAVTFKDRLAAHVSLDKEGLDVDATLLVGQNLLLGVSRSHGVDFESLMRAIMRKSARARANQTLESSPWIRGGAPCVLLKWFGDGYLASMCVQGNVRSYAVQARATSDLTLAAAMDKQGLTTGAIYKTSAHSEVRWRWSPRAGIFLSGLYTNFSKTVLRGTMQLDGATHGISKLGISAVVSV